LLNKAVCDSLFSYSEDVIWLYKGKECKVNSQRDFNRLLSRICDDVYSLTPTINNELINKHKLSSNISGAKANEEMIKNIAELTGLSYEQIARVMKNTIIYSHGIATMLATGVYKAPKKEIMAMIKNASEAFLLKERTGSNE
jgi:iron only hydrogenase large subunit-like protein